MFIDIFHLVFMYFVFVSSLDSDMICPLSSISERLQQKSVNQLHTDCNVHFPIFLFSVVLFNNSDIVLLYILPSFDCI